MGLFTVKTKTFYKVTSGRSTSVESEETEKLSKAKVATVLAGVGAILTAVSVYLSGGAGLSTTIYTSVGSLLSVFAVFGLTDLTASLQSVLNFVSLK